MPTEPPPLLGSEQLALMSRPVSIIVGTRDAAHRPHLMRAVGSRLAHDRRRLTLLLPQAGSAEVLADLRDNGRIAVVYSEPSSHRTLQLKGDDAVVTPCAADDAALAACYLEGFVGEIGRLGFAAEVAHTIVAHDDTLLAVHFTIAEAFEQTPGPAAGERLPPPAT